MRFEAIKCMSKSYRPTVPVRYAARVLGFTRVVEVCEAEVADGLEECEEWLKAHGAILAVDGNNGELQIDTKVNLVPSSLECVCYLVVFETSCHVYIPDRFLLHLYTCRNLIMLFHMAMHLLLWMIFWHEHHK
jgi:hypothetical protein